MNSHFWPNDFDGCVSFSAQQPNDRRAALGHPPGGHEDVHDDDRRGNTIYNNLKL